MTSHDLTKTVTAYALTCPFIEAIRIGFGKHIQGEKMKKAWFITMPFFLAHTLPQVLAEKMYVTGSVRKLRGCCNPLAVPVHPLMQLRPRGT